MEIQYKGANCLIFTTKKARLVVDDNLKSVGLTGVADKADISVFTTDMIKNESKTGDSFVIDGPGEYEISHISIKGIAARAHMDEEGKHTATIYRLAFGTTMVAVVGHIYPELSDDQLEQLGMIDILVIPVGGNGYTLDAKGAEKIIKKIDPKIVIPTHYEDKAIKYEVPQNPLEDFSKSMGVEPEKIEKLKIKNDFFPDNLVVYQLDRG